MQYLIDNMGVETYHSSSFKHELSSGFPFWVFLMTLTPHRINEGTKMKEVAPGTCIIYPPNYPRYLYPVEGENGLCNSWIHFTCSDSDSLCSKLNAYHLPVNQCFRLRQVMPVSETMQDLVYEFSIQQPHREDMSSVMIDMLLVHLSRNLVCYDTPMDEPTMQHLHSFEELRKRLYATPEQEWSVASMANRVFLSQNQFINLYRSFFHITPKQDLINARIQKAKSILDANCIIRDVALSVGFKNEYYFSTMFHRKTGLTPSAYAKINMYKNATQ